MLDPDGAPTAEGTELFGRINAAGARLSDRLLDGIDPQDVTVTERVLTQLTERAARARAEL